MVIDFLIALVLGIVAQSFAIFVLLILLALPFARPERPLKSGLLRLGLMALGVSALFSLFGSGGDCDCDLDL